MKFKKGFTLIELLVVIAIISLLSSIVLATLNSARDKGANAAIKQALTNIPPLGGLYYSDFGNYTALCSSANVAATMANVRSISGWPNSDSPCNGNANAWAAAGRLKVQEGAFVYWCVDSTGTSNGKVNPLVGTVCPAT